tara:strand:+ start:1684 stop:1998 length:315 start_codon:yes stop_codon:yes gene_type:complete
MNTYNVYFSVAKHNEEQDVINLTKEFVNQLNRENLIIDSSFCQVIQPGNFKGLPDYHLAVAFKDKQHMDDSFEYIREVLMNKQPHSLLMRSVKDFKVSFSQTLD